LLRKTHDVEQLQLTLKNAHHENVVAKREAKKLLRQAHDSPNPLPLCLTLTLSPTLTLPLFMTLTRAWSFPFTYNLSRLNSLDSDKAKAAASEAKADRDTDNQKVSFISFKPEFIKPKVLPSYCPNTTTYVGEKKGVFVGTTDYGTGGTYWKYENGHGGSCCGAGHFDTQHEERNKAECRCQTRRRRGRNQS
jgi:hypothetical protein